MLAAPQASAGSATLGERAATTLKASGLREAPRRPSGQPDGPGWAVEPMPQCGPERVAVRWHHPCPAWPYPGPRAGLDLCRAALTAAGYRVETVHAPVTYLAVLPPPGS